MHYAILTFSCLVFVGSFHTNHASNKKVSLVRYPSSVYNHLTNSISHGSVSDSLPKSGSGYKSPQGSLSPSASHHSVQQSGLSSSSSSLTHSSSNDNLIAPQQRSSGCSLKRTCCIACSLCAIPAVYLIIFYLRQHGML